ncbi:KCNB2-like protein [Mya arenaria]|uniref:KCNB2-like protein n=1 Tax=Mya arenaria TaxID=6604 RepID=A0ABY7F279_MYAAR|nr:KCNB2-like protein [Mya arenaria]
MKLIKLNVSGTVFEADTKCLERIKGTLFDMEHSTDNSNEKLSNSSEIYISRPAECFAAIFAFCQTEELHMPTHVCPLAFKRELEYWNIQPTELEKCCQYRTSSITAKVYLGLTVSILLLCIVSQAFSTEPMFRRTLSRCEMIEFMEHSNHGHAEDVKDWLGNPDCDEAFWDYSDYYDYLEFGSTTTESSDNSNAKFIPPSVVPNENPPPLSKSPPHQYSKAEIQNILPKVTRKYFVFDILEIVTMSFFTFDFCLRLFSCPAIRLFFFSILNLIDLITLGAYFAYVATIQTQKEYKYGTSWVNILEYIQILRIVRMFRIVKELRASRVLYFSLRQNGKDMLLLLLLFVIAVTMSGSLIYSLEDSETIVSIPTAWYWATITLTTVGYGDISPKTGLGRVLSTCLALCGVLLLAITLPMFVNNFLTLYTTACIDDYIEDKKQEIKGKESTTVAKEKLETVENISYSMNDKTAIKNGLCLDDHTKIVNIHADDKNEDHTADFQLPKDVTLPGEVGDKEPVLKY